MKRIGQLSFWIGITLVFLGIWSDPRFTVTGWMMIGLSLFIILGVVLIERSKNEKTN